MSRSILLPFATALSVFALAAPVAAQQRALTDEQKAALLERLKAADTNGDGVIDKAEAEAKLPRLAKRFDTLDADGNGTLSPDEMRAAGQKMAARRTR
ncbi:EF-hand domain-containing protein [Pseudoxanthomonas sp.]|jgi:Ca2+-binding EF-hand superfamily protein|uniref:EF-hand domain-containing protein n=1 Tax=Pseudoxanthomonas sp. TaxID=1871049 RepID=UPI002E121A86|nr:EF-hand domain-containing protein [Pseudoxanthomonas sp.]